ncbi:MAG: type VI secretion system contractile sheath small subunit [Gammaproteobacteria bacterium CG11_big_fil_rev_8_21_14_0_20_46_22]|nr:MAG: type VI secretion system contractile sheath small subunit [Gammaproteobacteria bacterium CG12_big_fil_rev_8_21_14_0_65_46_12]PIR12005.1 MAG: type VI secretion system contractile sheath small subunit [Gammaproteobacteria bacterium CG11_big_fil_rev_8_21_14_0_20_46_22]
MSTSLSRVHITYDVETDNGIIKQELPFVAGVMGDFSGHTVVDDISEREFIEVNEDSLNDYMQHLKPSLNVSIPHPLSDQASPLDIQLQFRQLSDFEPEAIIKQVPELKKLHALKQKIQSLLDTAARSSKDEQKLSKILAHCQALSAQEKKDD